MRRNLDTEPQLHHHRAVAVTESFQRTQGQPLTIQKGRMLKDIMRAHPTQIQEGEVLVGMKTFTPRGSPVFPEINCAWVERDLDTIATRGNTPFFVSDETKQILRADVFPYWKGKMVSDHLYEAVPQELWKYDERGITYNYFTSRTIGHFAADYNKILTKGTQGLIADVEARLLRLAPGEDYTAQRDFLESVVLSLEAIEILSSRYALEVERLAKVETEKARREELERIAAICRRVPQRPAQGFHEALQSFWFVHIALNLETTAHSISPGRFDQYMYPFLKQSLDNQELNQEQAQELLDQLWVKFDEITLAKDGVESDTSSSYPDFQNLNIGGLTRDGRDAVNDLSFMCLESLERTRGPQPGLSAMISATTQYKFLYRCAEVLKQGMGMPAMFNADTTTLGQVHRGKTLEDARASSINGCVAPYCDGKDRMASTGYFNIAKVLELALHNGRDALTHEQLGPKTGDPAAWTSFDDVVGAFKAQTEHFMGKKVAYDNVVRNIYAEHCPVPLTSALIDDCVKRAQDWHKGGAKYNITTVSGVGVGTVADALAGIKKHVFDEPAMPMSELIAALNADFAGYEHVHQLLTRKTPHYGNDDDYADDMATLAQRIFCDAAEANIDPQGGRYFVDLLPTTAHIALGETTGATPDGRRSGEWLSEGVSPVQGHDLLGPTGVAKSVAKLDHARCNGTLLNVKLSPQTVASPEDLHKLAGLIRGYFDQGGHHMQFNITARETLEDAVKNPEKHRGLLIRVAGYSDYFVLLAPQIQQEILSRTEHDF